MNLKAILRLAAVACLLGLLAGIWSHSPAATAVTVTPLAPPLEVADALGTAPDFRVDLLDDGSWKKLETYTDRPLGDSQRWALPDPVALGDLQRLRLTEDDTAGDDTVDEASLDGHQAVGKLVRFDVEVTRDMGVGLAWFAMTPIGLALIGAMVIGLGLSFLFGGAEVLDLAA